MGINQYTKGGDENKKVGKKGGKKKGKKKKKTNTMVASPTTVEATDKVVVTDEVSAIELVSVAVDAGPFPSELPRPGFGVTLVVPLFGVVVCCTGGEVEVSLGVEVGVVDVGVVEVGVVEGVVEVGVVEVVEVVGVVGVAVKGKSVRNVNQ